MEQYVESVKGETKSAASSLFLPLKMSYFLGDSSAKGHVEFDVWLYEVECLMKSESVSPDSMYNSLVPILIGTHILSPVLQVCRQSHGDTFLQVADLHTGYYLAFRSMILQQKELSIMKGRLCLIRCAESEKVVVGPNSSILLRGYMDKKLPFRDSCTVVQPSRKVSFSDLEIMPSIIQYRHRDNPFIDVRVHNTTTRTVLIPTRAVVCELQPVTIEQEAQENFSTDDPSQLSKVTISSDLSKEQKYQGRKLLLEYQDIFSKGEDDIGFCPHVKHRIDLTNETLFKIPHRRIHPSMFEEVKQHLKNILACGIITRSFSPCGDSKEIRWKSTNVCRLQNAEPTYRQGCICPAKNRRTF